jgi:hypothetical protein
MPPAHATTATKGRKGRKDRGAATTSLGGRANIIQVVVLLEIIILTSLATTDHLSRPNLSARSPKFQECFQRGLSQVILNIEIML